MDISKLPDNEQVRHFRDLWNGWYGGKTFHQEPLYPYALALIRSVAGPGTLWVHVVQMILGIGILLMLHGITRTYFGDLAALLTRPSAAARAPTSSRCVPSKVASSRRIWQELEPFRTFVYCSTRWRARSMASASIRVSKGAGGQTGECGAWR